MKPAARRAIRGHTCSRLRAMQERPDPAPPKAPLAKGEHGKRAAGEGWFVVNATEAPWGTVRGRGRWTELEPPPRGFERYGVNIHVLMPGEPNGMYHSESNQEDFLVLGGECLLLIEGEEHRLRQWDFVHCPPWTRHIFVGAGDGPCAILMIGARDPDERIHYPVDELARRHGAGVARATDDPAEAYAPRAPREEAPYERGSLPGT
jgi:uncharacterized cupin superfamily protein